MDKPPYEYEALKEAVRKCDVNIEALQAGIAKEEAYKAELLEYIQQHEKYRKASRLEAKKEKAGDSS
jgi:hypothetical protein